ncbi:MAG TPA: XRE family transcriptional regulator [Geminicoccus sp.]|jgi:transcriptional regulator with XRE-family HTH domain|uniref:helix-turn-helix domain-containing protein n=1 Tax=Geminicoccus sp. TaxID=2024832 RepID=UPI002E370D50|nr:XRE family transcriptional regulator [Geminicoccus sp.]HEX2527923.1 XRE family transcriptional regulator [Geminicoccus sp.]
MSTRKAMLGQALRAIRRRLDLTLTEVAARTGIAVSTLSKVENSQLSLTYDKLVQLSEGLEVDISAFFETDPTVPDRLHQAVTARRSIARKNDGLLVQTPNYDYLYVCTELTHKAMVPIITTIRARSIVEFPTLSRHAGEEFLYVLRGRIMVHTEYYEPAELGTGESMYLDSTMGHAFLTAMGPKSAQIINVCHSPNVGHFRSLLDLARAQAGELLDGEKPATT